MEDHDVFSTPRRTRGGDVLVESNMTSFTVPPSKPKTPWRRTKAVRFSDPDPQLSSGLTPMIKRTSVTTHKRRPRSGSPAPGDSGDVPDKTLHQTAQGRVDRRSRRNCLREALSRLAREKRQKESLADAEIASLRQKVQARDREIYELRNATVVFDTERIWSLEQQIAHLQTELMRRTLDSCTYSWKTAMADPAEDAFMEMSADKENFDSAIMAQLQACTPERVRCSIPTPPSTSPMVPVTPPRSPAASSHVGVQAELPDASKQVLEEELASMQREMDKLTTTLGCYVNLGARLNHVLSGVTPDSEMETGTSVEAIEGRVHFLLQAMADQTAALNHLTSAIAELGFPGSNAEETLLSLASGFRAARLELEYLTPGEIPLPLTSHGAEVLDLLLSSLRVSAKRAMEDEDAIDEYHALEQSLRKQIDNHVAVLEGLKAEMGKAQRIMDDKTHRIRELEVGNARLKGAVEGYVRDIGELERLVEGMERAHVTEVRSKDESIAELEGKMAEAAAQTAQLRRKMSEQEDHHRRQAAQVNRQHGATLALCDARVGELRGKLGRENDSLREADRLICQLRRENCELKRDYGMGQGLLGTCSQTTATTTFEDCELERVDYEGTVTTTTRMDYGGTATTTTHMDHEGTATTTTRMDHDGVGQTTATTTSEAGEGDGVSSKRRRESSPALSNCEGGKEGCVESFSRESKKARLGHGSKGIMT